MEEIDFNKKLNISIVGLGIIGGSFALKLSELGLHYIYGIDTNAESLDKAKNIKAINEGFVDAKEPLSKSDIIILCLYPNDTLNFVQNNMPNFKKGAIIVDTVGIKTNIINNIHGILRDDIDFVGGHPMAGSHKVGFDGAVKELFNNASFIITPLDVNKASSIEQVEAIMKQIGFGKIVKTSPAVHDDTISFTSQLPHLVSISYMNSCKFDDVSGLSSNSFEELTRIANINANLWSQLFLENKENVIEKLDSLINELINVKDIITAEDKDALIDVLNKGKAKKEELSRNAKVND